MKYRVIFRNHDGLRGVSTIRSMASLLDWISKNANRCAEIKILLMEG